VRILETSLHTYPSKPRTGLMEARIEKSRHGTNF
jgi:hypothetical protein